MDRYDGILAPPQAAPGAEPPRLRVTQRPVAQPLYAPDSGMPDFPSLASTEWESFVGNVGEPEDPFAVRDPMIFDNGIYREAYEREFQRYADSHTEPEGEEPYATRDNRDRLTVLQWTILQRCADRTRYKSTSPEKWTAIGIKEAYEAFATEEEIAQLLAEQRGETEPMPFRTRNAKGEVVEQATIPLKSEEDLRRDRQREISPQRQEMESLAGRARDPASNSALRFGRRKACYPCYQEKRVCSVDKRNNPDEICQRCLEKELASRVPFNAREICRILPTDAHHEWVKDKLAETTKLEIQGWEAKRQQNQEAKEARRLHDRIDEETDEGQVRAKLKNQTKL